MSFMKGDLLTRTRKLVKGLAIKEPVWLKAMEKSPPSVFPRFDKAPKKIILPEDVYVRKFNQRYPDVKYEVPVDLTSYDPHPARAFAWRVLEFKEYGVSEQDAMDVAFFEYRNEKKSKKMAYVRLKQIARLQGTKPPPNPYPSAIKEIQAEEKKFVRERFTNPKILEIVKKMKEQKEVEMKEKGWRPGFRAGFLGVQLTSVLGGREQYQDGWPPGKFSRW